MTDHQATEPLTDSAVAVCIRGVTKHFGSGDQRVQALREVDWDVLRGQISLIVGPSGCGKTTLLSVVAGILDADSGFVSVFGHEITAMGDREKTEFRARSIGFVFQQYNLLPALTSAENVAIPLIIIGWSKAKSLDRARGLLNDLGMGTKAESLPNELSGGQQQRVAIARALAHEPSLIVCDEPTSALDRETGQTVMELLREAAVRPDRAVVVVTHDDRIFHFGDRIAYMDDGRIVKVESQGHPMIDGSQASDSSWDLPATIRMPGKGDGRTSLRTAQTRTFFPRKE